MQVGAIANGIVFNSRAPENLFSPMFRPDSCDLRDRVEANGFGKLKVFDHIQPPLHTLNFSHVRLRLADAIRNSLLR